MEKNRFEAWLWRAALLFLFILLFVWQILGVIALRNCILVILFFITVGLSVNKGKGVRDYNWNVEAFLVVALTVWMLFGLIWATDPELSMNEIRGQWILPVLCGFMGSELALCASDRSNHRQNGLMGVVFWSFFLQVFFNDVLCIFYWLITGQSSARMAPLLNIGFSLRGLGEVFTTDGGDKFSYVNNTLACLLAADIIQRAVINKRWLPIGLGMLVFSVVSVLLCSYILRFRNGNVGLLLLVLFGAVVIFVNSGDRRLTWKKFIICLATIIGVVGLGGALYKSDPRWGSLAETYSIAVNKNNQAWLYPDRDFPKMENGLVVDGSAYLRISWAKEGLMLIGDHMLGTGYNRNAFGDGIDEKYNMKGAYRGGHSHSALIDFTISNGIPGIALWISLLLVLVYKGWRAFYRGQVGLGLALVFTVSGFFTRSLVDSNIRDHMLQQFMFLSMLLLFAIKSEARRA